MENSLTPRPPRGPGWGADSRTRGGRGPPSPPAEGRRGRPRRRGPERTSAQVVGERWRGRGAGSSGVSPARARAPGQLRSSSAPRFAAVCRPPGGAPCTWPRSEQEDRAEQPPPPPAPSSFSSSSRGPLRSPPPAAPLARSQSPPPGARGAGGKRLPPRRGAGRAGRRRARSCGAGGRARERGACAATALQRRPRLPRSRAEGPAPTPASSRGVPSE